MDIFEQYGIKEVANVTLYSIQLDENDDEIYIPTIYFDSLKVSTVNESKSQKSANGGKGNPKHIIWDYGKTITVDIQDALFTPASQSATWGSKLDSKKMQFQGLGLIKKFVRNKDGEIDNADNYEWITEPVDVIIDNIHDFDIISFESHETHLLEKQYIWKGSASFVSKRKNLIAKKDEVVIKYNIDNEFNNNGGYRLFELNDELESEIFSFYRTINDEEVLIAYFFMSQHRTKNFPPPSEVIYQLDTALEDVFFFERFEQCYASKTFVIDTDNNLIHNNYRYIHKYDNCELTVFLNPKTMMPYQYNTREFVKKDGEKITGHFHLIHKGQMYYKWTRRKAKKYHTLGQRIIIDATHFPGFYKLVGETKIRDRYGIDSMYQFEIPLCKMNVNNSLSLSTDGAPTVVNMQMDVLRKNNGEMMKLTKYDVDLARYDGIRSSSTFPINIPSKPEDISLEAINNEIDEYIQHDWPEDKYYYFNADFSTNKDDDEKIEVSYHSDILFNEIWGDTSTYEKEEYETLMSLESRVMNPDEYNLYEVESNEEV